MRLLVRNQTPEEAAELAEIRGMTLGQYFRAGGAPAMLVREELTALTGSPTLKEARMERLTQREPETIDALQSAYAKRLTFNELLALAGLRLEERVESGEDMDVDEARDLALVRTHLEDALTRYNSACYRRLGIWQRADPDRRSQTE